MSSGERLLQSNRSSEDKLFLFYTAVVQIQNSNDIMRDFSGLTYPIVYSSIIGITIDYELGNARSRDFHLREPIPPVDLH